jgi:hypothetical protein
VADMHGEHVAAVRLARQQMQAAQKQKADQVNKRRRDVQFTQGQLVLLSSENLSWPADLSQKLVPKFLGPFKVKDVLGPVTYRLELPSTLPIHPVFHVSRLKEWLPSDAQLFPLDGRDPLDMPAPVVPDDNQYEVDALLAGPWYRGGGSHRWYKVRWQGYGREHDEWVREDNISPELVQAYEQNRLDA